MPLNGVKNNIPSSKVKPDDKISLSEKQKQLRVQSSLELVDQIGMPDWVDVDQKRWKVFLKSA